MVTGGPGTGKTYSVARMLMALLTDAAERGATLKIALAAPTGKAKARLKESIDAAVAKVDAEQPGILPDLVRAQLEALERNNQAGSEAVAAAAVSQIGRTTRYDPAYVRLAYPGGDVPIDRGVCTDVVIRAYRTGLGFDLQATVHEDMAGNFAAYPGIWGLKRPDASIDHRRVPNLRTYFSRKGARLAASADPSDYSPGDLVTMMLPGNLPHIAIVTAETSAASARRATSSGSRSRPNGSGRGSSRSICDGPPCMNS